jgi:hypothetical protein
MFQLPFFLESAVLAASLAVPFTIEIPVDPRAYVDRSGVLVVQGFVSCSVDTIVEVQGQVIERISRSEVAAGEFFTELECLADTPTSWSVIVAPTTDAAFDPGFALVEIQAVGFDPESGIFAGVQSLGSLHLTRSKRQGGAND